MEKTLLSVLILLLAVPAYAEIYKWTDANGTVHYSDSPTKNAKPANLPKLQGLDKSRLPATSSTNNNNEQATTAPSIAIVRPQPQETLRDGRGLVPVQAAISPALKKGQQLIYYVDGQPTESSPTGATSVQLQGVPRGQHQVSVAVVVGEKEVSRSPAVVFHMKPPTALTPLSQTAPGNPDQQPAGATTAPPTVRSPGTLAAPRFNSSSGPAGN